MAHGFIILEDAQNYFGHNTVNFHVKTDKRISTKEPCLQDNY
jgi:hypothetical protein